MNSQEIKATRTKHFIKNPLNDGVKTHKIIKQCLNESGREAPNVHARLPSDLGSHVLLSRLEASVSSSLSLFMPRSSSSSSSSHERVASQVGDAAQVATVASHQDVATVAPVRAPAARKGKRR